MTKDISFRNFTRSGDMIGSFGKGVTQYRQLWELGPQEAEWVFTDDPEHEKAVPETGLRSWFDTRFMTRVDVFYKDSIVWRGWIGYMKLVYKGVIYIRDVREIVNTAKCHYQITTEYQVQDENGAVQDQTTTTDMYTDWELNEISRLKYGSLESVVEHDGDLGAILDSSTGAPIRHEDGSPITAMDMKLIQEMEKADHLTRQLNKLGNPDKPVPNSLTIMAFGASEFANRIKLSEGNLANQDGTGLRSVGSDATFGTMEYGTSLTVSQEIARIVKVIEYTSTLADGVTLLYNAGITDANDTRTVAGGSNVENAMDKLRELAKIPDQNGDYYELKIALDGGVTYQKVDLTADPPYRFFVELGKLEYRNGDTPSWDARPGLIRIIGQSPTLAMPGMWLPSDLIWARRAEMRENYEWPALTDWQDTEADYQQAMWDHIAWIEGMQDD